MKLAEIKQPEGDEDDEFPTAKLKNLGEHIFHGRSWSSERTANEVYEAAEAAKAGDGDVSIWYDWMSETVYEVSATSTTRAGVKRVLDAIKKADPRAHLSIATKKGMIDHGDWREYP